MKWSTILVAFSTFGVVCPSHAVRKQRQTFLTGQDKDIFGSPTTTDNNDRLPTTNSKTKKSKKTPKLDCNVKHKKKKRSTVSPASSRAPTVSPPKADCPTMISACSLLEMEQVAFDTLNYLVEMRLAITEPVPYVVAVLQQYLEGVLGQSLAGCIGFDVRRRQRRLQETAIMTIDVDVTHDSTCSDGTTFTDATCEDMDVALQITHDEGDPDLIRTTLLNTIMARCEDIKTLPGVSNALDPCPFIVISGGGDSSAGGEGSDGDTDESTAGDDGSGGTGNDGTDSTQGDVDSGGHDGNNGTDSTQGDGDSGGDDGNNAAAAVETQNSEERVQTGDYISIAIALILLLLLAILFVRRKRQYLMATKHKYLEDDGYGDETDTYLKDSDEDSQEVQARQVHVVGEVDSVFSGWTGYTKDQRGSSTDYGGLYPGSYSGSFDQSFLNQDVHKCSSATCEICEKRRQAGIQFVPTQMPSHSSVVPVNARRSYTTGDTVAL